MQTQEIAGNCLDALGMCSRCSADENPDVTCPAPSVREWECQYYRRMCAVGREGLVAKQNLCKEKAVDLGMDS